MEENQPDQESVQNLNPENLIDLMTTDIERMTRDSPIGKHMSYVIKHDDVTTIIIDHCRSLTLVELLSSFLIEFDHQLDVESLKIMLPNTELYKETDMSSIEAKEVITKMIRFLSMIELVFPDSESIRFKERLKKVL